MKELRLRPRGESALICPFCHDGLQADAARRCCVCEVSVHEECFEQHGGCPTFGCIGAPIRVSARARPRRRAYQDPYAHERAVFLITTALWGLATCWVVPKFASSFPGFYRQAGGFSRFLVAQGSAFWGSGFLILAGLVIIGSLRLTRRYPRFSGPLFVGGALFNFFALPAILGWALFGPLMHRI